MNKIFAFAIVISIAVIVGLMAKSASAKTETLSIMLLGAGDGTSNILDPGEIGVVVFDHPSMEYVTDQVVIPRNGNYLIGFNASTDTPCDVDVWMSINGEYPYNPIASSPTLLHSAAPRHLGADSVLRMHFKNNCDKKVELRWAYFWVIELK